MSARREEHAAFVRSALDRFERPLVAYALGLLGDLHAAQDCVQEAFLRLCREDRPTVEPKLAPWLYRVTRNGAVDQMRRRRLMPRTNAPLLDGETRSDASAVETRDATKAALLAVEGLPEDQREVTLLKFRHGLSYREIAEVTGRSPTHVGVILHEAMKALRVRLLPAPRLAGNEGGVR